VEVPDPTANAMSPVDTGMLPLGLDEARVKVVYTAQEAAAALGEFDALVARAEALLRTADGVPSMDTAVGIDVEWKPQFRYDPKANPASIVQIATRTGVYVLDVVNLAPQLALGVRRLLASPAVVKLGHGLGEDLWRLAEGLGRGAKDPAFAKSMFPVPAVLELAPLYSEFVTEKFNPRQTPSLARMVLAATGLVLGKRVQMTDWERRPLSPAQVQYAATDAFCSFALFDTFAKKVVGPELRFANILPLLSQDEGRVVPQDLRTTGWVTRPTAVFRRTPSQFAAPPPRLGGALPASAHAQLAEELKSVGVLLESASTEEGLEVAVDHLKHTMSQVIQRSFGDEAGGRQ
jgi:hypothetical protein